MPRPAIRPGEILADELTVADEKAGPEIARLATPLASPVEDQLRRPTSIW